jgi:mitogen-activated protein kinase organizer 1
MSGSYDASVRLWDVRAQSKQPIQIMQDARDSITSIVVQDAHVVTGSVDGHVRWYDVRAGEMRVDFFDRAWVS